MTIKNLSRATAVALGVIVLLALAQSAKPSVWLAGALLMASVVFLLLALRTGQYVQKQWRQLEKQVEKAQQSQEAQICRLVAFKEIAAAGGQSLDLNQVLDLGLNKAVQMMGLDAAEIHLLAQDGRTLVMSASLGLPEGFRVAEEQICIGDCLCGLAVLKKEPVLVADLQRDRRVTRVACQHFGYRSVACVPLNVKGKAIGVLSVHARQPKHFGMQDSELLIAIANQMATAIENANLYAEVEKRVQVLSQELQYMAVIQERERLGREMHDGLAQTLSLLHVQTAQLGGLLAEGNVGAAEQELTEMAAVIDTGYEEVREAITSLRLTAPKGSKFVEWLEEYVCEFGLRHDLSTELQVAPTQQAIVLPPEQEVQFTRIVQESMTNVRKHAKAKRVWVRLVKNGKRLKLSVEDDGHGFDVARTMVRRGGYGLTSMHERAEALGGVLQIQSTLNQGTTVSVQVDHVSVEEPMLELVEQATELVTEA